jgi:hypothetical protein
MNRCHQRPTVCRVSRNAAAISDLDRPAAHAKTICARCASPCAVVRAHCSSVVRSLGLTVTRTVGRPRFAIRTSLYQRYDDENSVQNFRSGPSLDDNQQHTLHRVRTQFTDRNPEGDLGLFTRKLISRELEPVLEESGNWTRAYLPVTFFTGRGGQVRYRGRVLKPQAGTGSRLQLLCKTTALRRARVRIPICVKGNTVVKVFVDGELARVATLAPITSGQFTLRILVQEVTRWTEASEATLLQLQFSYDDQSDSVFVLQSEDQPKCRPTLLQRRGGRYVWTSALYFLLSWANLLTVAVVALANLRIQDETLRTYAVLGTCVMWIAGLLGLPDLAKIPVRAWIRRLFAATRPLSGSWFVQRRRELAIVALTGVLVASGSAFIEVVQCYWVRQRYTSLIRQGERSKDDISPAAIAALKLVPWRREAQILIERSAFEARNVANQDERFRRIAAGVDDTPGVYAAIRSALSNQLPSYLVVDSPPIINPIVWYASLIIEGESDRESRLVQKAVALLSAHDDPESELFLAVLEMTDRRVAMDEREQRAKRLEDRLESATVPNQLLKTHSYLFAADTLAGFHLAGCEKDAASDWLRNELRARAAHSDRGETLWLRPPEKFIAFYLFALYGGMTDANVDQQSFGARRAKSLAYRDDCDFRLEVGRIAETFSSQFKKREKWENGTVFAQISRLKEFLEESLAQGWRY